MLSSCESLLRSDLPSPRNPGAGYTYVPCVLVSFSLHGNVADEKVWAFFDTAQLRGWVCTEIGMRQMEVEARKAGLVPRDEHRSRVFVWRLTRR